MRLVFLFYSALALLFRSICQAIPEQTLIDAPIVHLDSFDFNDLVSLDKSIALRLTTALVTVGGIEISGIPDWENVRQSALSTLSECLLSIETSDEDTPSLGIRRRTCEMTQGDANTPASMSNNCGESSKALRKAVDVATNQVLRALDTWIPQSSSNPTNILSSYNSFTSLFTQGNHVETLTTEYRSSEYYSHEVKFLKSPGLLAVLTTAVDQQHHQSSEIYMEMPTGVKARIDNTGLILLVGQGSEDWLAPVLGKPLKAVSYAIVPSRGQVTSTSDSQSSSSYFTKIYLPANNVEMKNKQIFAEIRDFLFSEFEHKYLNDNTANLSAYQRLGRFLSSSSSSSYCIGDGVSMFMEGFTSIANENKGTTQCVNFLFPTWTLDSAAKYAFACLGTLLMGITIQWISKLRADLPQILSEYSNVILNVSSVICYGFQVTLSYFVMLLAMTYSVELFCMVCVGLIIGFALFNLKLPPSESADPCCNYTDNEEESRTLKSNLIK